MIERVLSKDGIFILTCPNRVWEIVHWICAAININHSEGPHRFLKRSELTAGFKKSNLHLMGYSIPVNKECTKKELFDHIYYLKKQPTAIPYITSYYKNEL